MIRPNMSRPPGPSQLPPGAPRPGMPPPLRRVDSKGPMLPPNQNPNVPVRPMPPPPQNRPPWPMNRPPFPPNFQGRPPGPPGLINRAPVPVVRPPPQPFRPSQPQVRPPPPLQSNSSSSSLGSGMGEPITNRPQPTIKKDDDDVVFGSDSQLSQPNLTSFTEAVRKSSNIFGEAVEDSNFDNFRKLDLQTSKFFYGFVSFFYCTAIKFCFFFTMLFCCYCVSEVRILFCFRGFFLARFTSLFRSCFVFLFGIRELENSISSVRHISIFC